MRKLIGGAIYFLSGAIGVLAFIYPFFMPTASATHQGMAHSQVASLVTAALVTLSLVALLIELQGQTMGAKTVAMLGVLVAIASLLRFVEVAVPMPGGFSPVFAPIILAGYAFGARFGFLMGVFTLLVSALVTGGVGPWLPYQMFAAGWIGLTAGWLSCITGQVSRFTHRPSWRNRPSRFEVFVLSLFGFAWGLLYGVIINVYFWPFAAGPIEQTWNPGMGLDETLARYAAFYVVTSLGWDLVRAAGNAGLILVLGAPAAHALERFQRRFQFETHPANA